MALLLFAVIGFAVGYWLEMSRAGYITMALTAVGFGLGQIALLFATQSREAMTLLPLIVGLVIALFMLVGALSHWVIRARRTA
jgi:hypothetical protein